MTDKLEEYISKQHLRFILEKIKERVLQDKPESVLCYIDGIILSLEDGNI